MHLTASFKQNISATFGKSGQDWLQELPNIVLKLKERWGLSGIDPFPNMTYHFVAKATQFPNISVVLKIGCDKKHMQYEDALLKHFQGEGAVRVLDFQKDLNALLLEQANPGHTLKSFYPSKLDMVMNVYGNVVHKIHSHTLGNTNRFPSISQWLEALDKADFDTQLLHSAKNKRDALLSTMNSLKLLHGDLHLDNILENDGEWICIDPKGVLGEPEFEAAAFDIFAPSEIATASTPLFLERIDKLAKVMHLAPDRLRDWFFVRLVLSAAWSLEDGGDPSKAIKLATLLKR